MSDETPGSPSDAELADRVVRDGSEPAFRTLYRRHTPPLYRFVLRLVGSPAEAEDVVQDTWVRAVAGLPRLRWEASFRTWLLGIGLNRAREVLRRAGRRNDDSGGEAGEAEPSRPAPPLAERLDLEAAIRTLPEGCREVLLLHDLMGLTHEEIGRQLAISGGTSKSQLHSARRALRRLLTGSTP
jgi:RNA polymerase sigma-70 factor, ECF subfamily